MATYPSDEWRDLMRKSLMGDEAAYASLLTSIRPWLMGYFTRRLKGADTEDLVQMTLLSLHTKRATYDDAMPFVPWLCAVARHKLIDHVRKYHRHVHIELDETLQSNEMEPSLAMRDITHLLQSLPKDQAQAIALHKLKELSVEEVSVLTGFSVSNIKVLVHRGLKRLSQLVGAPSHD